MSYAKTAYKRSAFEIVFITIFLPAIFLFYGIYKYPQFFVDLGLASEIGSFYLLNKNPGFWYSFVYTALVCGIALKVVYQDRNVYKRGNKKLTSYQKKKFTSIFLCQLILFFLVPYIFPYFVNGKEFFNDQVTEVYKNNYIYMSRGFTSWTSFTYIFVIVPLSVWFFGKRYCSWFCACGNLAETIGVTKWGAAWVKHKTPTGKLAKKLENLQLLFMILAMAYGLVLFMDIVKIFSSKELLELGKNYQDFVVDFIFGAVVGVGAYPFYGTRIWCRYGCPLAKFMEKFGKFSRSKFKVQANDLCKGIDLCSQTCPMGIDVASYAHKDKKPTEGSFGLCETPCVGCGGCIDVCPVDALSFK
jgi:ferredoxin-type protein NapH